MELEDNYSLLQDNVISVLRNYPRFLTLLKCIAPQLDNIQTAVDYMCENTKIDTASGIWLDYIAWLVGTNRNIYDVLNYFCVNADHLNVEKLFYFQDITANAKGSLQDVELRKKIKAKIAYNNSKATRNQNIYIIQGVTNADKVIISNVEPMVLDITIIGDYILYPSIKSLRDTITAILGNGVGIRNLTVQPVTTFYLDVDENNESELPTDEIYYEINKEL